MPSPKFVLLTRGTVTDAGSRASLQIGRSQHTLVLARSEDVDASNVRLRVAMLAGLRRGVVDDLAGEALDDDVATLLQRAGLNRDAVGRAGSASVTHDEIRGGGGPGGRDTTRGGNASDVGLKRRACDEHGGRRRDGGELDTVPATSSAVGLDVVDTEIQKKCFTNYEK